MHYVEHALGYIVPFLVVLTVLIFVHEFGHYWVARRCRVKIDSFSIGFGQELFGWTNKAGVRWKVSALPLGGYVKMVGDEDGTSWGDSPSVAEKGDMAAGSDPRHSQAAQDDPDLFANKPLLQRAAVVSAGPIANFLFTILIFTILFSLVGERFTKPDIGEVVPGTVADKAGLKPGDLFLSIDGRTIKRFEEIQTLVQLHPGDPLDIVISRNGTEQHLTVTPDTVEETDRLGIVEHIGRLGIKHDGADMDLVRQPLGRAVVESCRQTWAILDQTLTAVWQIIKGTRPADQMSGVIAIAKISGDSAHSGMVDLVYFMALLSVNLGLLNLFPIPMLDGGHLLFYGVEAVRGKAPGEAVMKYSFRFGLAVVLTLALFSNWNDLVHLGFLDFLRDHIS